jgi:hypothetical protein
MMLCTLVLEHNNLGYRRGETSLRAQVPTLLYDIAQCPKELAVIPSDSSVRGTCSRPENYGESAWNYGLARDIGLVPVIAR